jgi:Uma2 family endonuclease
MPLLTSGSLDHLEIYAALGVPEVWRFDGEQLLIYVLQNGSYERQEQSQVLSILRSNELLKFLKKRGQLTSCG